MSVPVAVRRRWGLTEGAASPSSTWARLMAPGARLRLLADALSAGEHLQHVAGLDDPDLATTY